MIPQPIERDLFTFTATQKDRIMDTLSWRGDWISASEILRCLHMEDTESNRRKVRKVAETLDGQVISSQCGYRSVESATEAEIRHFAAAMRSQARKMMDRADKALEKKGIA